MVSGLGVQGLGVRVGCSGNEYLRGNVTHGAAVGLNRAESVGISVDVGGASFLHRCHLKVIPTGLGRSMLLQVGLGTGLES